jgi:DNA-binding LacI/PurR family transcriptional regulator
MKISKTHKDNHPITQFERGYQKALGEFGLEKKFVYAIANDASGFHLQLRGLVAPAHDKCDGVLCMSDSIAFQLLMAADEMGVSVPEQLGIVGFYDTPWSRESKIPITSVSVNLDVAAETAVKMLMNPDDFKKPILIEPSIVIRESTSGIKESRTSSFENGLQQVV